MKISANNAKVTAHRSDAVAVGGVYQKLTRKVWGQLQRSLDGGKTWHTSTQAAFWTAYHSDSLMPMTKDDEAYLLAGGILMERVSA
jgi:hypothetical protein